MHDAITADGFECQLTLPGSPRGMVLVIDGDLRDAARRRTNGLVERLAAARYGACAIEPMPRYGLALVSSDERKDLLRRRPDVHRTKMFGVPMSFGRRAPAGDAIVR